MEIPSWLIGGIGYGATFSPGGSAQEIEDYPVSLQGVTKLELVVDPDRGRRNSVATLNSFRVA